MTVAQLLLSMHAVSSPGELRNELNKERLLAEIEMAGKEAVNRLAHDSTYTWSVMFPRGKARIRWRGQKMRFWRLNLVRPLWLGDDGVIYRGYDIDRWPDEEFPQYLVRAEIELRGVGGLQRVLRAVRELGTHGT